jgi:hypothetical protein
MTSRQNHRQLQETQQQQQQQQQQQHQQSMTNNVNTARSRFHHSFDYDDDDDKDKQSIDDRLKTYGEDVICSTCYQTSLTCLCEHRVDCARNGHYIQYRMTDKTCYCMLCQVCITPGCVCSICQRTTISKCLCRDCLCPQCDGRNRSKCISKKCKCPKCGRLNLQRCASTSCWCSTCEQVDYSKCKSDTCWCWQCGKQDPSKCTNTSCVCPGCDGIFPDLCINNTCKCQKCGQINPGMKCPTDQICRCDQCGVLHDWAACSSFQRRCTCHRLWDVFEWQCVPEKQVLKVITIQPNARYFGLQVFWAWVQQEDAHKVQLQHSVETQPHGLLSSSRGQGQGQEQEQEQEQEGAMSPSLAISVGRVMDVIANMTTTPGQRPHIMMATPRADAIPTYQKNRQHLMMTYARGGLASPHQESSSSSSSSSCLASECRIFQEKVSIVGLDPKRGDLYVERYRYRNAIYKLQLHVERQTYQSIIVCPTENDKTFATISTLQERLPKLDPLPSGYITRQSYAGDRCLWTFHNMFPEIMREPLVMRIIIDYACLDLTMKDVLLKAITLRRLDTIPTPSLAQLDRLAEKQQKAAQIKSQSKRQSRQQTLPIYCKFDPDNNGDNDNDNDDVVLLLEDDSDDIKQPKRSKNTKTSVDVIYP